MAHKAQATQDKPQTAQSEGRAVRAPVSNADAVYQQKMFISMALSMSWQLALVVIVPIVGGHILDQHYHKEPLLTLVGLAVAAMGVFGVLHRMVTEADRVANQQPGDKS